MNHDNRLEIVLAARDISGQAFARIQGRVQALTRHVFSLNGVFVALGGAGVIGMAVGKFSSLEKGLIGVQKTTDMTDKQIEKLGISIEDMTTRLEKTIPVTSVKLLEIAEAAGQLGIRGNKNILLFTETIAKLERATDLIGGDAAKKIARLMNVTGESVSEVDILGSVIVALGNNMAATESEILSLATEIGQATSVFAVGSAEATAMAAAMKSIGVRAELGGSVVGRAMRTIESSINKGGESFIYLQKLTHLTGDELKKTFREDSTKVFQAWLSGIGQVIEGGASAEEVFSKFGLKGEEILKVLPAMATKSDLLARALLIANKETKDATALTEESIRGSKSFSAQMIMTMNVVDRIASKFGKGLAPEIIKVTKEFRKWFDENQDIIDQNIPQFIDDTREAISDTYGVLKNMKGFYDSLPKEITGAAGAGILGAYLFGGRAGKVIGTIVLINSLMEKTGNGLSDLWEKQQKGMEIRNKLFKSIKDAIGWNADNVNKDELNKFYHSIGIGTKNSQVFSINKDTPGYDHYAKNNGKNKVLSFPIDKNTPGYDQYIAGFKKEKKPSPTPTLQDDHTKEIIAAYSQAYSQISTVNQVTYDHMAANYKKDYEAFVKLTGDKETAQLIYFNNMESLNAKTLEGILADDGEIQAAMEAKKQLYQTFQDDFKRATMTSSEYELDQLNQRYEEYSKHIDNKTELDQWYAASSKEIVETSTDTLKDAFSGWANSYVSELNEMVWGAEMSFSKILESFGKMLTQMQIQKSMSKALDWTENLDWGSMGSSIASMFAGGNGATALSNGAVINSSGAVFGMAGGGVINEHVVGVGLSSGSSYEFGEGGVPEAVIPKKAWGREEQKANNARPIIKVINVFDRNNLNQIIAEETAKNHEIIVNHMAYESRNRRF
ncbi:MAG: phage tail tape measure protein [Desulfobacteraceae bacterium]|nr:phage tail tape measure protein [Desulfobacteraceae bacterium]